MNKLLRSVTTRMNPTHENENGFQISPNHVDATITVDIDTWRYFEKLDEDSRDMMARVLRDYVERQK